MPTRYSDNWEVHYYGERAKVLLIDVISDVWPTKTQVTYSTYQHALSQTCELCGIQHEEVEIRHQNTAYVDDWKNYHALCLSCQSDEDDHWQEQWNDFYASRW